MHAIPCTRCRTPLPAEARFCMACGAGAPDRPGQPSAATASAPTNLPGRVGFAPPGQGLPICLGCGVVAPREGTACTVCELDLPPVQERPAVPPVPEDHYWVAVRCQFQCRVCGHLSSLNHLDMDGSVVCLRCGMSQIFDVASWNEGLEHAHAVGDLAGPDNGGRGAGPDNGGRGAGPDVSVAALNPFRDIGIDKTVATSQQSGMVIEDGMMTTRSLRVDASPGHPLCRRCRTPLQVTESSSQQLSVACPTCGDSARYEIPPQATATCKGLRGVMADEHRAGNREARIEQGGGGAEVIRCPNCSAAVSVTGASTIVDCEYCHVSLRIPSRVLQRRGHHEPRPLVWWLLFQGPSARRRELIAQVREEAQEQRRRAQRRQQKAHAAEAGSAEREAGVVRRVLGRKKPRPGAISVVLPLVVTALVGHLFFRDHVQRWLGDADARPGPAGMTGAGAPSEAGTGGSAPAGAGAAETRDRSAFVSLDGCTCRGRLAGERVRAQLAVHVAEGAASADGTPAIDLAYFLDVGETSHALRSSEAGAPPTRVTERFLGIGMACRGDMLAVAAGDRVTGWSMVDGTMRWDVTLDAPYRHRGKPVERGIDISCARLRVRRGRVRVPTGRRQRTAIDMRTGRVRR